MFRFDFEEPVNREIRRLVLDELKDAIDALRDADTPLAARIHEARKHLKRLRAVLALVSDCADPALIEQLASSCRSAAAALATPRGHAALLACFDELVKSANDATHAELRSELEARANRVTIEVGDSLEAAAERLREARQQAKALELDENGFAAIGEGFRATYRSARRALRRAGSHGNVEAFHAFRKPSKRHAYQLRLFEAAWDAQLGAHTGELELLGELLGEHHDLCLLQGEVANMSLKEPPNAMIAAAERRVRELERMVLSLGTRCFAERPGAITRRIGVYFNQARRERRNG
ncbi:MAG: CHAD domain-containing protein [Polyangiaceae bacterium]